MVNLIYLTKKIKAKSHGTSKMPKYNIFELNVNEILKEAIPTPIAEPLNAMQRAAHSITGSSIFDGPGLASNKYDANKNYYPNIRKGWGKIFNIGGHDQMDAASQAVIRRIEELRQQDVPQKSKMYSPSFVVDSETQMKKSVDNMKSIVNSLPSKNGITQILDKLQRTDVSLFKPAVISSVKNRIETWIQKIEKDASLWNYNQKAHLLKLTTAFKDAFEIWVNVIEHPTESLDSYEVDAEENSIEAIPILKIDNTTIYKDKWNDFLNTVQNGVVGAGQHRFKTGANAYSILTGSAPRTYGRTGMINYKTTQAVGPEILKNFHEKIMLPLFIKPSNVLLYATAEQWNSISKGGVLYKTVTGLGKQIYTAGQNAPRVSL